MKKRKKLTARQMLTLEKHSEHHTKKHMDFMKKEMSGVVKPVASLSTGKSPLSGKSILA